MKLHTFPEEFRELITVVANEKHISESAVERDYYIVMTPGFSTQPINTQVAMDTTGNPTN